MKLNMKLLLLMGGGAAAPVISTTSAADLVIGTAYSQAMAATGTVTTWSLVVKDSDGSTLSGHGLSINSSTGSITGTPVMPSGASSQWTLEVTATNGAGADTDSFNIIAWLFRDEFDVAPSAGLWAITDTTPAFSVSGSKLRHTTHVGFGNPGLISNATFARKAGRVLFLKGANSGTGSVTPRLRNATPSSIAAVLYNTTGTITANDNPLVGLMATANSTDYDMAIVEKSTGLEFYKREAGTWKLRYIEPSGTATNPNIQYLSISGGTERSIDAIRMADLPGTWKTTDGFAGVSVATPTDASSHTGTADQVLRLTLTAPGTLTGDMGLRFRISDASNYHYAFFDSSGNFRAYKVVAGVPTEYSSTVSVGSAITTSAVRTIMIVMEGSRLDFITIASGTPTLRATSTDAFNGSSTGILVEASTASALANLISTPVTSASYNDLNTFLA